MVPAKNASKAKSEIFPPWFLSRSVLKQVQQLLPNIYHKRLFAYFQRYGCMRCNGRGVLYCCNGLCRQCTHLLIARLRRCDRAMEREYRDTMTPLSDRLVTRVTTARELLSDLVNHRILKVKSMGNKPPAKSIEYRPVIQIRESRPGETRRTAKLFL